MPGKKKVFQEVKRNQRYQKKHTIKWKKTGMTQKNRVLIILAGITKRRLEQC